MSDVNNLSPAEQVRARVDPCSYFHYITPRSRHADRSKKNRSACPCHHIRNRAALVRGGLQKAAVLS